MALPRLNESPKYEIIIPSTQKSIRYRPFLVKEQKVLLMALESEDQRQILNSIVNTIEACVIDPVKTQELTTFDVEYMFTQIRAKSVGETSDIQIKCKSCEHMNPIKIKLDDIKVDMPKIDNTIKLDDKYAITMRFPKYASSIETAVNGKTSTEQMYSMIANCLDTLNTDDEIINFADEAKEDILKFVESLTSAQFEKIVSFVRQMPQLKHDVQYDREACGEKNEAVLQGMQDFFS